MRAARCTPSHGASDALVCDLWHSRVFGLKEDVSNTITFLDDQTIFYPAGSNCIIYNHETRSQKFIPVTEKCDGITVLAVSGSKRFGVVAERSTTATAVIYDLHSLRRRKTLIPTDAASKEFVCMAFSSDAKYLLTQSGAPDWALYYWMWEKNKLMASVRTVNSERSAVVYQVSFSPTDNTYVCCIGNGILKFYRYQEGTLKIINATPKFEAKNFLCHAWVFEERVAVGTEDGKILIIEPSGELKAEIDYTVGLSQLPKPVYSMVPLKKGFVCGGGGGTAAVYERNELATGEAPTTPEQPRAFLRKVKDITTADESVRIITMAVSPNEELLVCSLDNRQLFSASLNSKVEEPKFEQYMQSFHHGQITGLDTCIRKPLIVTCATDRSIRVWNYQENTCELVKYFQEETYSVAIHPSGLYILVGFSDKLKLMNLLIDDIRPFREFSIRGCKECRFSTGGQYFAAVYGNTIQIFSTWNFENLANLKGHNGKVRSIYWTNDDSKIVTAGMDGAIYDWLLKDLTGSSGTGVKREGESILKSCSYTCAISSPDGKTIFAVGSDRTLKEITDSQIVKEVESDCVYTQIVLSHSGRMMFAGNEVPPVAL
ncbi:WD40-repeat-containing domain protein [Polychytrium aggregatum]|uniref:WD40-repeat-containing domain protein n=1 Tax=Polychytrium aggregatum TaxID=110093 RepID=UPI0022FE4DED|nr:WD40-repeat-containing domain protein [Polychytrium aggregatum]KAI9207650.1 WD40-repeat-containing domain protein [Polychytrium aggregatum]